MRAKIFCRTGKFQGLESLFESDISIGRAKDNGVHLDDTSVSGYHARIHYDQELKCYTLADTNSRNGTRLDGQRVKHAETLEDLHIISIAGKHELIFQDLTHQDETAIMRSAPPSVASKPQPTKTPATKVKQPDPAKPVEQVSPLLEVIPDKTIIESDIITPPTATPAPNIGSITIADQDILSPPNINAGANIKTNDVSDNDDNEKTQSADMGRTVADSNFSAPPLPSTPAPTPKGFIVKIGESEYDLTDGEFSVGRVEGNHIIVNENSISRRHATIKITSDKVTIEDSGSKNGVRVDEVMIDSQTVITANSKVFLGDVPLSLMKKA